MWKLCRRRFVRSGRKNHDHEGRERQQSGDKIQAPAVATGLLADHANHHRADETAEVADGVDSGNASGRSRAAEEQGWHAPQRGFDALIPTVTSVKASITVNNVLTLPAYISPAAASRQAPMTCQLRSLVRSE